jgi:hypothetical protein
VVGTEFLPRLHLDHGRCSGGESDEGLRPQSEAGCWFADRQKRMAVVAGAGLTRATKIGKERPSAGAHGHLNGSAVGGFDFGAWIDCDSANGTSELVLMPRPLT